MVTLKRRYERIEIELPCRLFIPEGGKSRELKFEAFVTSRNLSLGGVFVESTLLMKENQELYVELALPSGPLPIHGRIVHAIPHDHPDYPTGMGVQFLNVTKEGRETLLRYFTPLRYQQFYGSMTGEFKHLEKEFGLPDVSLILNLWEEWKVKQAGGPSAIESGVPGPRPRAQPKRSRRRR